jgi:transglutaminase-like putative cysteine protease
MNMKEGEIRAAARSDLTDAVPCVPVPPWVEHDSWPPEDEQSLETCSDNGLLRVLYDCQVSLMQPGIAWHVRVVQRILTRTGAERAAHVAIEFNPAHDRLEVHFIRVWRGEQCIEQARAADFQILRRETQLERLALDGRLTATLLVPDLRADDRLETSFTIYSQNPILSGRYSSWIFFDAYTPWVETRQRLIRPVQRTVFMKAFNEPPTAAVTASNGVSDSRWSVRAPERLTTEELTPPWSLRNPCYQVTEFEHWSEISQLFEKHYQDVALPPELVAELDKLASRCSKESELAIEWLRLVQKQLRYFALALGDGGLVPRSLTEIWTKRFGDCKDAARLYVAGARYLGLDGCAALVSTTSGPNLVNMLPSPQVFNHVAVRLRIQEATHWVDPTMQLQGGTLEQIALVYTGWALPLTRGTTELEFLPALQAMQHISCEDIIRFGPRADSAAVLERRIDFHFLMANAVRNRIEGEGLSKVSAQVLQEVHRTWPDAVEKSPAQVQDDFTANRLSLLAVFEIRNCWKAPDRSGRVGFNIADPFVGNELAPLKDIRRHSDIFLGRPRKTTWRARLQMPRAWNGTGWRDEFDDAGIRFRSAFLVGQQEVVFERDVEINSWSIASDKAEAYAKIAEKVRQNVATLWARADLEGNIGPMTGAQMSQERQKIRWPLFLWLGPVILGLRLLSSVGSNANDGNYVVDRSAYPSSNLLPAPEAHVSSFAPVAVDAPLENCLDVGGDSIGPYLHSSCKTAVKVRLLRPSGIEPYDVTISPGGKSYVYFMQLDKTDGSLAACPAADQIVDKTNEMPWAHRGNPYRCQHPIRHP